VQLLEPCRILHIGLAAGHAFDVPGVDQIDFDSGRFQQVVSRNPVVAGAFHGGSFDAAGQQPVAQGLHIRREAGEGPHRRTGGALGRHSRHQFAGSDVDPRRMGMLVGINPPATGGVGAAGRAGA